MWLVVYETDARNVYVDGRGLEQADVEPRPEGQTGGSLNMVPADAGYWKSQPGVIDWMRERCVDTIAR